MNKTFILALIAAIALSACGRLTNNEVQEETGAEPGLIALNDGTIMNVACVRQNAKAIMAQGRGAASACVMGNAKEATDSDGRGFSSSYPNWWSSYYIYPPYYYGGSNNNYGSSLCGYLGFYGNGYSSTNGYGYGYGYGSSYNCYYDFLGYDPYSTSSYNSSCDYCLNRPNPSRCYNRCLYNGGWYW
jgi:hypothetical protein